MGRIGLFLLKLGRSVSFLSKNGWEWVVFLEKWVGVGESDWKWVRVTGSGWEPNSVKPYRSTWLGNNNLIFVIKQIC